MNRGYCDSFCGLYHHIFLCYYRYMSKKAKIILGVILSGIVIVFIIRSMQPTQPPSPTEQSGPPKMEIDATKSYQATLTTSLGDIVIQLYADKTPITVNNFVHLSRTKFYDGTPFHRIIKGFMIQGGDPKGTGMGGPGYSFADEPFEGEYTRGTLAMANAGPNTNGSQFFIMHADYALPKNYIIFGKAVSGLDVVDAIATAPVIEDGRENSKPVTPVTIKSISITEK